MQHCYAWVSRAGRGRLLHYNLNFDYRLCSPGKVWKIRIKCEHTHGFGHDVRANYRWCCEPTYDVEVDILIQVSRLLLFHFRLEQHFLINNTSEVSLSVPWAFCSLYLVCRQVFPISKQKKVAVNPWL